MVQKDFYDLCPPLHAQIGNYLIEVECYSASEFSLFQRSSHTAISASPVLKEFTDRHYQEGSLRSTANPCLRGPMLAVSDWSATVFKSPPLLTSLIMVAYHPAKRSNVEEV